MRRQPGEAVATDPHAPLFELVDASPDGIWLLTLEGAVTCMNCGAQQLFGRERSDVWTDGWPEENRLAAERALATSRGGRRASFRLRHSGADGAAQYLDITVSPMRDGRGEISLLLAMAVDVTAQIESRAFLSTIVDALPQALTVYDLRSKSIALSNRSADELWASLHAGGERGPNAFEQSAENDPAVVGARRVTRTDVVETPAGPRRFSTLKIATYDDSGARHLISLSEDVTAEHADREAAHEALLAVKAADEAKNAFLANMSHEIRTPLNGVVAGLDVLWARMGEGGDRDLVDMVRDSAAALTARIDELFAAGSVAVVQDLHFETIELTSLLHELVRPFVKAAEAKNVRLVVASSPDVPAEITGDRHCLLSALRPLVDNAVKFTDRGSITVRADHLEGDRLRISIIDTGVGFDPEDKDQLFVPFARQDQSLTRRFGGLGLGLGSARTHAERMGGVIDAEPRPEGGAIFWMELPLEATAAGPQVETFDDEPDLERLQVLVADDHATNRRVLELILESFADVTAVVDGQAAVEAARSARFDMILMDIQMPVMDGISAVAAIREHERAQRLEPAPVIMLTANAEEEYVRASRTAGADRHIAKPFTAAALIEGIHAVRMERGAASFALDPVSPGLPAPLPGQGSIPANRYAHAGEGSGAAAR